MVFYELFLSIIAYFRLLGRFWICFVYLYRFHTAKSKMIIMDSIAKANTLRNFWKRSMFISARRSSSRTLFSHLARELRLLVFIFYNILWVYRILAYFSSKLFLNLFSSPRISSIIWAYDSRIFATSASNTSLV